MRLLWLRTFLWWPGGRGKPGDIVLEPTLLNDRSRPLQEDKMELLYAVIRESEEILGLPGSDVRLKRLEWERDQFLLRALTRTRSRPGAARHEPSPHEDLNPSSPSSHEALNLGPPVEPADDLPAESEAELKDRVLRDAYERSMAIVAAGRATGERRRGTHVPEYRRHTIAPWLYKR
jgi:hypothetical protein